MGKLEAKAKYAVIGYGSWATAIIKILTDNGAKVEWYIAKKETILQIQKTGHNPRYLKEVKLKMGSIELSNDINKTVENSDIIVLATPSAFLKQTLEPLEKEMKDKFIISAIKGIVPDHYLTVAEYLNQIYDIPFDKIGVITGPCHSEEVAQERLSYLTMVCKSIENAEILCSKFRNNYIRANPSTDIYGAEYAAVLKNVYAIAAGLAKGLGAGDNLMAVLISNAAVEMNRFISESYPTERESTQATYLGDLLVSCYSQFSRNRALGALIGEGLSVEQTIDRMEMIAEGYYGAKCIVQVNKKYNIEMPIAESVYRVLYEEQNAEKELEQMTTKLL